MKKVVVVGFGFMGMTHTLNALKNKDLQLVAIVDKDIEGIDQKITKNYGGNFSTGDIHPEMIQQIPRYRDLATCMTKEEVDAVIVCVHTDLHFEIANEALKNGKHVFLEKPISLDLTEGETLIKLANDGGLTLMVGHVLRFMPPYQKLKEWIDEETYGTLKFLSVSRFSGVPAWGEWKEKQKDFGSTGGALFDLLIHDIDLVHHVLGVPKSIKSFVLPGTLSKHDFIDAVWEYENSDVKVKVEGGNIFHSNFPFHAGYTARFEEASVFYSTLQPEVIKIATVDKATEILADDGGDGFYNELAYFGSCIINNESPEECTPESALETIKLCYNHI